MHHVTFRGLNGERIFLDAKDYEFFLERLALVFEECRIECDNWALIPNHGHLQVETGQGVGLSTAMHRLLGTYSGYFNRRYGRTGYLFGNRFYSKRIRYDRQWYAVFGYVPLNPHDAYLVNSLAELDDYPWTGHSVLMGRRDFPFPRLERVLPRFSASPRAARRLIRDQLAQQIENRERGNGLQELERALADEENDGVHDGPRGERYRDIAPPGEWEALLERVAALHGVDRVALSGPSRARDLVRARADVVYEASTRLGMTLAEVGRRLGMSRASTSRAARRGREAWLARGGDDPGLAESA
jgi:REP element-mobilizing transposase RayT